MAHQADLVKIGMEGFAIIDEYFVKRGTKPYPPQKSRAPQNRAPIIQRNVAAKRPQPINHYVYQPTASHVYHETIASATEAIVVTNHETAMVREGSLFMDFPRRTPSRKAY
ncbi:hypothetical protein BUALT_Bualt14G0119000 [Buddleja alternifolia]|uniref:Uncharacterized protein n=1 Tax=Buddleja alternifolia TaxID=168488 RepID=A0AAV6WJV5_9LAMI|nr:hypothetical protein BUALT_Bualt14G0118600 [Buddleja alternifolia]KAG8370458.1 hypothetical protein BUALT_Bualt14G0119000 [Buddleja alternifolia]